MRGSLDFLKIFFCKGEEYSYYQPSWVFSETKSISLHVKGSLHLTICRSDFAKKKKHILDKNWLNLTFGYNLFETERLTCKHKL